MLEADNISIAYGEREVVSDVSFTLRPGELTAIVGPNGAGKSTILKSLNGRLKPASGSIKLDGKALEAFDRRAIGRQIAVVAQEAELRFPVTVMEFVLGGRFAWSNTGGWGWETEQDIQIATQVLAETELTELSGRLMNELSGGERQRAVLARALTTDASHLLLDEPTANLDLSHQATLLRLVRNRCKVRNATALVVTHDLNLAAQFADRALVLKGGSLVKSGNTQEVFTGEVLQEIFGVRLLVSDHPSQGGMHITPVFETNR